MKISTPEKDAEKIIKQYKNAKTPDDFDKIFDKVYPKYIIAYQEAYEKEEISGAEKDEFVRAVDKELSVVTMTEQGVMNALMYKKTLKTSDGNITFHRDGYVLFNGQLYSDNVAKYGMDVVPIKGNGQLHIDKIAGDAATISIDWYFDSAKARSVYKLHKNGKLEWVDATPLNINMNGGYNIRRIFFTPDE